MTRLLTRRSRQLALVLVVFAAVALVLEVARSQSPTDIVFPAVIRALLMGSLGFLGGYIVPAFQVHNRYAPRSFVRAVTAFGVAFFSLAAVVLTVSALLSPERAVFAGTAVAAAAGFATGGLAVWAKHFAPEDRQRLAGTARSTRER